MNIYIVQLITVDYHTSSENIFVEKSLNISLDKINLHKEKELPVFIEGNENPVQLQGKDDYDITEDGVHYWFIEIWEV